MAARNLETGRQETRLLLQESTRKESSGNLRNIVHKLSDTIREKEQRNLKTIIHEKEEIFSIILQGDQFPVNPYQAAEVYKKPNLCNSFASSLMCIARQSMFAHCDFIF